MNPELSAAVVGAIIGAGISWAGSWLTPKVFRPKLEVIFNGSSRVDAHVNEDKDFWFRVRVGNAGNVGATNVELVLYELHVEDEGAWKQDPDFIPLNLTWSNVGGAIFPSLPPRFMRHCDLFRIRLDEFRRTPVSGQTEADDITGADLQTVPRSPTLPRIPCGRYKFVLFVGAANSDMSREELFVTIPRSFNTVPSKFMASLDVSGLRTTLSRDSPA